MKYRKPEKKLAIQSKIDGPKFWNEFMKVARSPHNLGTPVSKEKGALNVTTNIFAHWEKVDSTFGVQDWYNLMVGVCQFVLIFRPFYACFLPFLPTFGRC